MSGIPTLNNLADGLDSLLDVLDTTGAKAKEFADRMHVPIPFNYVIAGFAGLTGMIVYIVIGLVIAIGIPLVTPIVTLFLKGLTQIRTDTLDAQVQISNGALSEFLGVEVNVKAPDLAAGKGAGTLDVSRAVGNALYDRLNAEFGVAGGDVGPGEKA